MARVAGTGVVEAGVGMEDSVLKVVAPVAAGSEVVEGAGRAVGATEVAVMVTVLRAAVRQAAHPAMGAPAEVVA